VPTFGDAQGGGAAAAEEAENQTNIWETRLSMRVDALATFAYLLGPISGAFVDSLITSHTDGASQHSCY
jgi:hypothetical protein